VCLGADGILSPVPYAYGRVKLPVLSRLRTVQEPRSKDMLDPINPSFDSPKMISFSSTFQKNAELSGTINGARETVFQLITMNNACIHA